MSLKINRQCPKCQSADIALIPGNVNISATKLQLNMWATAYLLKDLYVCKRCGHFEEYIQLDRKSRKKISKYEDKNSLPPIDDSYDEFV